MEWCSMQPAASVVARAPGHPLCLSAAAVLFLNDHIFKQTWPGLVTGKLSDVCWLIATPVVIAAILVRLRLPPAHARLIGMAGVGLTFTVLQVWAPLGDAWTALMGWQHVADLGDLLTLPALALACLCWRPTRGRRLALPLVAIPCVATQPGAGPVWQQAPCDGERFWDPNRPLTFELEGTYPDFAKEAPGIQGTMRLEAPDGTTLLPMVWAFVDHAASACPIGGLQPNTEYTWTFDGFTAETINQAQVPDTSPFVITFETASSARWPLISAPEDCSFDATYSYDYYGYECQTRVSNYPTDTGGQDTGDTASRS